MHDRLPLNDLATHRWVKNFLSAKKAQRGGLEKEFLPRGTYRGEPAIELVQFGTKTDGAQIVPGMAPFESHHIIPRWIQRKLQACLQKTWDIDDVPSVLLTRDQHWYPDGLHAFIGDPELKINWGTIDANFGDDAAAASEIMDALQEAYRRAGREDLVKVVQQWRQTVE